jgi:hypothetical protein
MKDIGNWLQAKLRTAIQDTISRCDIMELSQQETGAVIGTELLSLTGGLIGKCSNMPIDVAAKMFADIIQTVREENDKDTAQNKMRGIIREKI